MGRIKQTEDELLSHLKDQIEFLLTSTNLFDGGFEVEAKRLTVVIRTLVHDTKQSIIFKNYSNFGKYMYL